MHLDKIASVTRNLELQRAVTTSDVVEAVSGSVVVGRVRGEKTVCNHLEDVHGRTSVLHEGDVIAGALDHRNALDGRAGVVPDSVCPQDVLNLLNLGGVIGRRTRARNDSGASSTGCRSGRGPDPSGRGASPRRAVSRRPCSWHRCRCEASTWDWSPPAG